MTPSRPHAILRADAAQAVGSGHVLRCCTLAAELGRRGWTVELATRDLDPALARVARAAGASITALPPGLAPGDEPAYLATQAAGAVALVVVDHYGLGSAWHRAARGWAGRLVAIDDLVDRELAVDVLLNPNLGMTAERYAGLLPPGTVMLAGPKYALVDPAFAAARRAGRARDGRVGRLLVFISGTDPQDATRRAAEGAAVLGVPVDVVVGATYPHRDRLRAWAAGRHGVEVHVDTREMAALMARADVAVGAAGTASWERCTVGLPTVLVIVADNQVENARRLEQAGAALNLGRVASVEATEISAALTALAADPSRVQAMSAAAAAITDGEGARRVADALGASG